MKTRIQITMMVLCMAFAAELHGQFDGATEALRKRRQGNELLGNLNVRNGTIVEVGLDGVLRVVTGGTLRVSGAADFTGATVSGLAAALADGDKGEITVSGSGATWTIDNGVVTASKLSSTLDLSAFTLTLPSDVTRLGSSIDLGSSEVTGTLPSTSVSGLGTLSTRNGTFIDGSYFHGSFANNEFVLEDDVTGFKATYAITEGLMTGNVGVSMPVEGDILSTSSTHTVTNKTINSSNNTITIAASRITSGTIATARLGSGTASSSTFLRGDNTWATPAGASPAGTGSELQFRSSGSAFGAVTRSSVSGGVVTLGDEEAMGVTSGPLLTLRNTTSAAAGAQQVSPSLVLEGRGWRTNATAQSQTVRFRQNVLPVQGAASPSATWRLQSEVNNSGTWVDGLQVQSDGRILAQAGTGYPQYTVAGTTGNGFRVVSDRMDFWISGSPVAVFVPGALDMAGSFVNWGPTVGMHGGADGGALAFRAGVNAQEMHVANTYTSFTNKEFGILGWRAAANIFTVGTAKGSGGGTARAMSLVTDGVNRLTIDALGRIIPVLPTSAAGLPTGALWNDGGTVKVAP